MIEAIINFIYKTLVIITLIIIINAIV